MANQFYTYKIVFSEEGGENNETPVEPENGEKINTKNPTSQKKDSAVKTAVMTTALQQIGKNTFNIVVSNLEEWTGNSGLQDAIDIGTKTVGYGVAFASNWVVGLIALATDITSQIISYNTKQKWANIEASQKEKYLGIINKRSR